jgi:hypothetical protein
MPWNITAGSDRLNVVGNLSLPGYLYCSAFSSGTTFDNVQLISSTGNRAIAVIPGTVSVTIRDLSPVTNYDVYCYSSDFANHIMPLAIALQTKIAITTSCCRAIEVLTSFPRIPQYVGASSRSESIFQIQLNSKPISSTSIVLSYQQYSCITGSVLTTASDLACYPNSFTFTHDATSFVASFVIRATTTGCYSIKASTTPNDYLPAVMNITLQNIRIPPVAPVFLSAYFSGDGSNLYLNFDSSTDQGASQITNYYSQFNCSQLVIFNGVSNSICKWSNSSQLLVIIGSSGRGVIQAGDMITLRGQMIKAACQLNTNCLTYAATAETQLFIQSPPYPNSPIAYLFSSRYISSCDRMTLDPTASIGHGGRPWLSVLWSVTAADSSGSAIENYLNSNYQSTTYLIAIPASLLSPGQTYQVLLQLVNFLGITAYAEVTVSVGDTTLPIVSGVHTIRDRVDAVMFFGSRHKANAAALSTKSSIDHLTLALAHSQS